MKGTADSYFGINESFEINEVDNKNSVQQINSTTDNQFETVSYAQQKQQHNGFFFNVNNMEQKIQPKNAIQMMNLPETQQNQQLVESNNVFIENSSSENIFYMPNPLNMVQENQSLVPNTLSQLYNNPTESLTTTQPSMMTDENIVQSVHMMPHQNHNIIPQEIQNTNDNNGNNTNSIHIHHHHHHHHITQHENPILPMQEQNPFIQPDMLIPEDQQNKISHTQNPLIPREDVHNGTSNVMGQNMAQSNSPPISTSLLPPLQPVLNMSQSTMALDPINKENTQENEQGSLSSFSSDSGTPSSKDSVFTLSSEKKKVNKKELVEPKTFKSNSIRRRHSLSIMNHVDYNELKNYHDLGDITSDFKASYKKDVKFNDVDHYFSLLVGPGKHQVKEFNILPINVIKLKYKSKSSDYIVVKLVCDESMKMEENEIFLTAVSAYHTQEDSNYVYLPNLKISQQMLRGRTKGYKFKLKYILVIDGTEMERKESNEFYLWSNINQKGFPREERMSYVDNKVKSSRKRRKK